MALPPTGYSSKSNWWPNSRAVSSRIPAPARVTSGPMPSPGKRTLVLCTVFPQESLPKQRGLLLLKKNSSRASCRQRAAPHHFVRHGQNVALADLLGLVGQGSDPAIALGKLRIIRLEPQFTQTETKRAPSGMFAKNQLALGHAHRLGRNDFVRQWILDDAVLMDAGFVGEGVGADNGFIRRHAHTGNRREQAACRVDFFQMNAGGHTDAHLPTRQCHH